MNKKNDQQEVNHSGIIASEITKTIMDYCSKSGPVSLTHIVKALSDVLGAHLATLTNGWTEEEEEKVVNLVLNNTVSTMLDCKKSFDEDGNK
jgi:hypothetical protein